MLPSSRAFAPDVERSITGEMNGVTIVLNARCSVPLCGLAAVLAEMDHAAIAGALRVLDDDVAQQHGIAFRAGRLGGVDQVELAVGRMVNVAVFDTRVVGPALDVVSREAMVDLAEPQRDARAAEVEIVVVARLGRVAVAEDPTALDPLIDAAGERAVAVGHDAHVVAVDRAVADGNVIGLIDPHAGAVVAGVVGAEKLEAFEQCSGRRRR